MTIYLDHNASAPLRPEALALMTTVLAEAGNASSIHGYGRAARARIEGARDQVGALAGVQAQQVIFTSGATESNNAVLQAFRGKRLLISALEHPSVRDAAPGAEIIPVTADGVVDEAGFAALLERGEAPALISIMMANNETGAIQDVEKFARMAKKTFPGVHVHVDAVQAAGRIIIDFQALQADYLSLSAHKIGGPQGVGALIVAPGAQPVRLLHGGGQEKRQRAGTENVAGITGFGVAAELALNEIAAFQRLAALRDDMERRMKGIAPGLIVFGENAPRVANTSGLSVPGTAAQTVIMALDLEGIAVSSGAACSSGTVKPSPGALAMGLSDEILKGAFRVSTGWNTKAEDVDAFVESWGENCATVEEGLKHKARKVTQRYLKKL